ncbi:MFS transporter [Streptomyces alboflavus]|uniref:MFS transporter n=1 Tax=Streptomyces alboflavus TaxID=67267 RepID=UPI0012FE8C35|nr:MFS transporter [Streptomyces alboflavus]
MTTPETAGPLLPGAQPSPRRWLIRLLAGAYGLTIANLYYCQPLLPRIGHSLGADASVGQLVTVGQVGYLLALLIVVPLGDIVRRRPLVCVLLLGEAGALAATAVAPTMGVLLAAGAVTGLASAGVVNVLVPYAATLAPDHERGRVVATVLSGGMAGVLLSRTVAGLAAEAVGWRGLFWIAALVTLLLAGALARALPSTPPDAALGYTAQLRATVRLVADEPVLRRRSLIGACVFASFGVFWATAAFLLAGPPYHYTDAGIGWFALLGAAGALAARGAGRFADRGRQGAATGVLLLLGTASFTAIAAGDRYLAWLVVGVLAMDIAVQGTHMLNLSVVYGLVEGARARIASAYMTGYTLGGVAGSAVGTAAYRVGGWHAVSAAGAAFTALGLVVWAVDNRENGRRPHQSARPAVARRTG